MTTVQVVTLGCSKNTVDTEHLLAMLPADRFEILPEEYTGPVDCLLINTCGFIGDAKQESINTILAAAIRRREGSARRLLVFGCLSQRYSSELPELIPEVDGWFGARDLAPVAQALGADAPAKTTGRHPTSPIRSYAFIKISEGCDRRCSYCAIPYIRGAHKSVPMEDIVEEATLLAAAGARELVLIAQDTTYYGLDLYRRRALAELLQKLSAVPGIEWIRIHYSYPDGFPDDVLEQMATNPKVCKYLDIPLQHISDKVLGNMHRHVDGAWTRSLIRRLRAEVPGVVLRTTMIVGHPGEGPDEFGELLDFVREARFERLGAFRYSEEEGTWGASHLKDDVPEDEKQRRFDELMQLQSDISFSFNQSRVGGVETLLVDACADGVLICRSQYESPDVDGQIFVPVPEGVCADSLVGTFVKAKITEADLYDLRAELV